MDAQMKAKEKWSPIILEMEESGQSARCWCREHDVNVDQFYYWRRKLGMNQQGRKVPSTQDTGGTPGIAEIRLVLPQDHRPASEPLFQPQVMIKSESFQVYVGTGFDDETLRRVLGVVKTC